MSVLTINGGSSSIKFALYNTGDEPVRILHGKIERIGLSGCTLTVTRENQGAETQPVTATDINSAADFLIDYLEKQEGFNNITAIGHRIVHGMDHTDAEIITQRLIDELEKITSYDPDHLPGEIQLIKAFRKRHPNLQQVACFDTSFHTTMPQVARMFALPHKLYTAGVKRYGFHGLSYSYIMQQLGRINNVAANGRVIIAHLGNGASMAAVNAGKCIDTSMGFTPAGGFMMGTRPGDLDPGVTWYLMQKEAKTPEAFNNLINHQSGLLGVSETSSDMQDLLKIAPTDIRATQAVDLFCYQVKKWIGAFTAALAGLDALVFTGGIGENSPVIRSRVCEGLQYLGIDINEHSNGRNETVISAAGANPPVYAIPTNEEIMIAKTIIKLQH